MFAGFVSLFGLVGVYSVLLVCLVNSDLCVSVCGLVDLVFSGF